jgi:uroporphyrinogen decarboxylase
MTNKRDLVLNIIDDKNVQSYFPAGFFIHFDKSHRSGQAAVNKHIEYFRYTGMDIVKIQYETIFPLLPEIARSGKWGEMPFYGKEFYEDQLSIAKNIIKEMKKEALVIMTLYSPFMCARSTIGGEDEITKTIMENPEEFKKGMGIITESLMSFVKNCIDIGIDGFYASTQGGENHRFSDPFYFNSCIKPYDLTLMNEIDKSCIFNILHICDFRGKYDDLNPFLDYPGHVVSFFNELNGKKISAKEISELFNRPVMGGMDRKGIIVNGNKKQIIDAVTDVLKDAPEKLILGADCTLPDDVNWENIKTAISAAHLYEKI